MPISRWPMIIVSSVLLLGCGDGEARRARSAKYTVIVSIDGLASRFLSQLIAEGRAPTFERLQSLAAWTHNARTDTGRTITLPNHTCMITGYPVLPPKGQPRTSAHGFVDNVDPGPDDTLHNQGNDSIDYQPSIFDVAHDHGRTTALFASKTKFVLYTQSYNDHGADDQVGEDNGNEKIDYAHIQTHPDWTANAVTAQLATHPTELNFVHFAEPDLTGHRIGWGSDEYLEQVTRMDWLLAKIVDVVRTAPKLRGRTALIVTTDHGGEGTGHTDSTNPNNFTIPFYLLAPGVEGGQSIYDVEGLNRVSPPQDVNPGYDEPRQPVRNGDSGNLALWYLGLPPVPGSLMHNFFHPHQG